MKIPAFIVNLWNAIKRLFTKLPAELKDAVHIGVVLVENIKKFVDSPGADILTAIIPGNIDNVIIAKLRQALPIFLQELKLADETMSLNDPEAIVRTALQSFKELDPFIKPVFCHNLSVLIAQVAADGQLSWSDGVAVQEWYYKNKFKAAA